MQLDRNMLQRLLELDDDSLTRVIQTIAAESGIDPSLLGIDTNAVQSIRSALGSVNDKDLEQLNVLYREYRKNRRR